LPDPDLMIRTSGEMRVSNFLLWQIAYAEIFVTETLWPDFNRARLLESFVEFQKRERRYGGIREGGADPEMPARVAGEWWVGSRIDFLLPALVVIFFFRCDEMCALVCGENRVL